MSSRRALGALFVVALVALGLRAWGVGFGLPSVAHDDEWQYVANSVSMRERWSPTVTTRGHAPYINPTGFTLAALPITWAVDVLSDADPALATPRARYRADRGRYHLAVRGLSVVLGVLTVLVVFWTARAFSGRRAALLAAALLAVSPLHVRDSHFATNDVALSLLMIAAFGVLLRARGDLRRLALGGALFGAACATKYSAAPLLLVLLALLWRRPAAERGRALGVFLAAGAGAFVLLFPASVLDTVAVIRSVQEQAAYGAHPWPGQDPGTTPWLHLVTLARALGPFGLGLAVWGWLGMLERRRWVLASYPVVHLMMVLPLALFFARLDLPLLPFLCLAVAFAARRWSNRRWAPLLVAVLLAAPALCSVRISGLMSRPDTRAELGELLAGGLQDGTRTLACEVSTTLRFLPRGADGMLDPRLKVFPLSPGSCKRCKRPLVIRDGGIVCPRAGCVRGPQGVTPEQMLDALERGEVEFVLLTSNTWNQRWSSELLGRIRARWELVLFLSPGGEGGERVPFNHEERYGPWDNLWTRERPGPEVRVYALPR